MTVHLDDTLMFRPALDGVHGLDPGLRTTLSRQFSAVQREVTARTAAGEYGFMDLAESVALVPRVTDWAAAARDRFDTLLLFGDGGAVLGAAALPDALVSLDSTRSAAADRKSRPALTVLDSIDPITIERTLAHLAPERTLVMVISQTGDSTETLAQYLIARQWLDQAVGEAAARDHLVIATGPGQGPLRIIAQAGGITTYDIPEAIGERYGVLSSAGLLPAALLGIDIRGLLAGAAAAVAEAAAPDLAANSAARWAAWQWQAQVSQAANIHVLMPYSDRLMGLAEWCRQLWGASLGKRVDRAGREMFRGPTPVAVAGAGEQHSALQLFLEGPFDKTVTLLRILDTGALQPIPLPAGVAPDLSALAGQTMGALLDARFQAVRRALRSRGRMNFTIEIDTADAFHVGELLMFFQIATGFAGVWYGVNPFDQPAIDMMRERR